MTEDIIGPFDSYRETLAQRCLYKRLRGQTTKRAFKTWSSVCNRWEWWLVLAR